MNIEIVMTYIIKISRNILKLYPLHKTFDKLHIVVMEAIHTTSTSTRWRVDFDNHILNRDPAHIQHTSSRLGKKNWTDGPFGISCWHHHVQQTQSWHCQNTNHCHNDNFWDCLRSSWYWCHNQWIFSRNKLMVSSSTFKTSSSLKSRV